MISGVLITIFTDIIVSIRNHPFWVPRRKLEIILKSINLVLDPYFRNIQKTTFSMCTFPFCVAIFSKEENHLGKFLFLLTPLHLSYGPNCLSVLQLHWIIHILFVIVFMFSVGCLEIKKSFLLLFFNTITSNTRFYFFMIRDRKGMFEFK